MRPDFPVSSKAGRAGSVLEPDQGSEAAGLALAAIGIIVVRQTSGAQGAASNMLHASRLQTVTGQRHQVHAPVARAVWQKGRVRLSVSHHKGIPHLIADLIT